MPIYHYVHDGPAAAEDCGAQIEAVQSMSDAPLTTCPRCGCGCHRVLTGFSVGRSTKDLLKPSSLAAKGFTQYKRAGDGVYEKTAGTGPKTLNRDSL